MMIIMKWSSYKSTGAIWEGQSRDCKWHADQSPSSGALIIVQICAKQQTFYNMHNHTYYSNQPIVHINSRHTIWSTPKITASQTLMHRLHPDHTTLRHNFPRAPLDIHQSVVECSAALLDIHQIHIAAIRSAGGKCPRATANARIVLFRLVWPSPLP